MEGKQNFNDVQNSHVGCLFTKNLIWGKQQEQMRSKEIVHAYFRQPTSMYWEMVHSVGRSIHISATLMKHFPITTKWCFWVQGGCGGCQQIAFSLGNV